MIQLIVGRGGGLEGVHTDALDLTKLGTVKSDRASDILWDAESQGWRIELLARFREIAERFGMSPSRGPFRTTRRAVVEIAVQWLHELLRRVHG